MSKDPAFLFYPGDWDGGTKLFSRHEKGAYLDLLMCQFHSGHMSGHEVRFILGQADYDLYWEAKLKSKFIQDDEGKFYNKKLEDEQIKRRNWCESRANNKKGNNQYSGQETEHMSGHTTEHMENENKDVNKDKNKRKVFIPPSLEQVKLYCDERKNGINPQAFIDHYQASNWVRGKTKISDWKACVRTWEQSKNGDENKKPIKQTSPYAICERCGAEVRKEDFAIIQGKKVCIKCPEFRKRDKEEIRTVQEMIASIGKPIPAA